MAYQSAQAYYQPQTPLASINYTFGRLLSKEFQKQQYSFNS